MRGDWRNYSDEQWMRLESAVAHERGYRRSLEKNRWYLIPLSVSAAFLFGPAESERSETALAKIEEHEMKSMTVASIAVFGSASVLVSASAQELLVNGALEGVSGAADCAQDNPSTGSTLIPGWTVTGPWNVDWMLSSQSCLTVCPKNGLRYVDLNGSLVMTAPASAIAQTAHTMAGARYRFSVFAMANSFNSPLGSSKTLRVTTGSLVTDFPLLTSENPSGCPCPLWSEKVVYFTATSSETLVELRSMFPNNAGGIFVDAASLIMVQCSGDVDLSGSINGVDLAIVLQNWGVPSAQYPRSDINGDGVVNGSDLALVLSNWGACP